MRELTLASVAAGPVLLEWPAQLRLVPRRCRRRGHLQRVSLRVGAAQPLVDRLVEALGSAVT